QRLRYRRIVDLTMPMTPVADHVDDDVAAKPVAELQRDPRHTNHGVHVLCIHMENWNALPPGQLGRETRGMQLLRYRGKSNQIVHDHVQRSTNTVRGNIGEIQSLSNDALPRECAVAVNQEWQKFLISALAGTVLLGARAADCNRIHGLEVTRI